MWRITLAACLLIVVAQPAGAAERLVVLQQRPTGSAG
jgi:hypothetical protein